MKRATLALLFLVGAWSGCSVFMWQVAIQNFAVAEGLSVSSDEGLRDAVNGLSDESLRSVLRYQASEVNRLFFGIWGWVQLPIAVSLLVLVRAARCGMVAMPMAAGMLLIAVGLAAYVVPETVRLGRLIDFAAESSLPDVRSSFWTLHHTYTTLDMLKFALGLGVASIAWRRARVG